jgi:hypothetical protein
MCTAAELSMSGPASGNEAVSPTFTFTLSNPVDVDVTFHVDTTDGTAVSSSVDVAGVDYTSVSTTLTIAAHAMDVSQAVAIGGDVVVELDEHLTIGDSVLSAAGRDVTLAATQVLTYTILNDDSTYAETCVCACVTR